MSETTTQTAEPSGEEQAPDANKEILNELGIEPDEAGRIPLADHQKLLNTVKTLREQMKGHEAAKRKTEEEIEKARLATLGEAERAIEQARAEGYKKATEEQQVQVIGARVVAEAATLGFLDPQDALHHLDVKDLTDEASVRAAVAKLAKDKAYLLKPKQGTGPRIEQGPQGSKPANGSGDWLGDRIRNKRSG